MIGIFLYHNHVGSLMPMTGDSAQDFELVRKRILGNDDGSITRHPTQIDMSPDAARRIFQLEDDEVINMAQALQGRTNKWEVWCDEDGEPKSLPLNLCVRSLSGGNMSLVGNAVLVPVGALD